MFARQIRRGMRGRGDSGWDEQRNEQQLDRLFGKRPGDESERLSAAFQARAIVGIGGTTED